MDDAGALLSDSFIQLLCMYMHVWSSCISVSALCPRRVEEDTGYRGTKVTGVCELPCGRWEPSPVPL